MFATIQAMESSDFLSLTRDLIGLKKLFDGMQEEFRSEVLAAITERWLTVDSNERHGVPDRYSLCPTRPTLGLY